MEKKQAILTLGALAHDSRMDIFRLLVRAGSYREQAGGLAAGDIAARLSLPAPTLSFHLKELSRAGLVEGQRRGRSIIYQAQLPALEAVASYLLHECCQGLEPAPSLKDQEMTS